MEKKSPHILNASSNLLGFSLIIITSLKITKMSQHTNLDEFAGLAGILFACSCFFSFLAIRTESEKRETKFETIADYLFLIALFCVVLAVIIVTVKIM
jgi:succinate-acetate transporter protein